MNKDLSQFKSRSTAFFNSIRLSRPLLNLIFICALIFLLVINFFAYQQVRTLITANRWVSHTYQVITTMDNCLFDLVDIESRLRGNLLRHSDLFMDDIDAIKSNLKQELDNLKDLTKDNVDQNARVDTFAQLVDARLNILNKLLQLKPNVLNAEENVLLLDQSQDLSNRVKGLGQEIKSVELVLLKDRNAVAVKKADVTSVVMVIGSFISILFLTIAFLLANIELRTRKKMENHGHVIQTRLRQIIESASDMIAALDNEQQFIVFNEAYQREFKRLFDKTISIHMNIADAFSDIPPDKRALMEAWITSLQGGEVTRNIEWTIDDEKNTYELNSSLIHSSDNQINGLVHSVRNITKRIQEHTELQDSYQRLAAGMEELRIKNHQITLLVEMSDIMLACSSLNELSEVMGKYSLRLLPFTSGYLFIMHPSKNYLEKASCWGTPQDHEQTFTPEQCWAIRLGRIHQVSSSDALICTHIREAEIAAETSLLCVRLMAQNDIYGLLYIEASQQFTSMIEENQRLLITAFAELTALALANVRLRENLRHQSIRDPLTGLYNRRYLEDFLFKHLHQAERTKSPFALLMLDLDHFKKINDTFGHDAGDNTLKELGTVLHNDIRLGDIASRFGGEEFILVFYNIDLSHAKIRAETLRAEVNKIQIKYGAQPVGPITASIGLAMYPEDGKTAEELIEAADKALYFAKNNGRNQVAIYSELKPEEKLNALNSITIPPAPQGFN